MKIKHFRCKLFGKKMLAVMLSMLFISTFSVIPIETYAAGDNFHRVINVVYDDSASMFMNNADTWCRAKYSMEVCAAMLGESDVMNIYYMSDFGKGKTGEARLILNGSDGASENVGKIHNMKMNAADTPFSSVEKAYADIASIKADEKWVFVLTDGEFETDTPNQLIETSKIQSFLDGKDKNVKIMMLSMGDGAEIGTDEANHIYFEKAKTSKEILSKITDISMRLVNANSLDLSDKTIEFDVPMKEIVVFAQGKKVNIKSIKKKGGEVFEPKELVNVKYTTTASENQSNFIKDGSLKICKDLVGKVAVFKGNIESGKYTVNYSGADSIEIYYKPNIDINAYVKDEKGKEVTNLSELEAGTYDINFGFVNATTKKKVGDSKLLGNVKYQGTITNGKNVTKLKCNANGVCKNVPIDEGKIKIDIKATFLDYNSVSTTLDYSIYKDKKLKFSEVKSPTFTVDKHGIKNGNDKMIVRATLNNKPFTKEQWANTNVPTVTEVEEVRSKLGDFKVAKSSEIGCFEITPTLPKGKPTTGTYEDKDLEISYHDTVGKEAWTGSSNITMKMEDKRSWLDRNKDLLVKGLIALAILALIAGYIPPFKKYLPKKIDSRPSIEGTPRKIGFKPVTGKGSYNKDLSSTLIPYKAETGTIRVAPKQVRGYPSLKVKASGKKKFYIINTKDYEGKNDITFDGASVPKDSKKVLNKSAGLTVEIKTEEMKYTCRLKKQNGRRRRK